MTPTSVAVVVTTYRDTAFLGDALRSVMRQTRPADQVVVVDDGSDDDPRPVVARFPRAEYVVQPNQGPSAARNTGLARLRTDAVVFLDADDVLSRRALADGLDAHRRAGETAFVCGRHRRVDVRRRYLGHGPPLPPRLCYLDLLRGNVVGMHAAVMYRVPVLRDLGGFDVDLRRCEDYEVYLRIARRHPVTTHGHVVADYRQHGTNSSSDPQDMLTAALAVLDRHRPGEDDGPEVHEAWRAGRDGWRRWYGPEAVAARKSAAPPSLLARSRTAAGSARRRWRGG